MLLFTRANGSGKRVAFDPLHIGAVVEWGEGIVGIRIDNPEPIRVLGDFMHIVHVVAKAKRRAEQKGETNYAEFESCPPDG